ncbi:MAG: zinc ribbon domain-containing protein [Bryobacteraceae bacterium]|jgi:putative FmdB family regulatory protein
MPLYEYRCSACGETFEQLRRTQDADYGLVCPACQSGEVQRLLSVFASRVAGAGARPPCGAPSASACGKGGFT